MNKTCLVCKGDRSDVLYPGILACRGCGFVSADLDLTDGEFEQLYQHDYFHDGEYRDYRADAPVLRRNFRLRLKVLRKYLEPGRHKHLLEIGSAYGFFLETAKTAFETVEGVDIFADGVRHAREALGLDVHAGDFLHYDISGRTFDVVCLWDTIEHLRRPDLYLEKVGRHTGRGALLAVTTGDIASLNARLRKRRWRLIHPPTHAHYFSRDTLSLLLDRCGFDVIYSGYCGFYRSVDQVVHGLQTGAGLSRRLYDVLRRTGITELGFYLNLYDIMYLIARRR